MNSVFKLTLGVIVSGVIGCEPAIEESTNNKSGTQTHADGTTHSDHGDEGHSHDAPHGGAVADWGGGEYHVEFLVDHDKQEATVYVLGSDCKSPAPIETTKINLAIDNPSFQMELSAMPQENDTPGKSSRFVGTHEKLGVVQEFAGKIFGVVDRRPFSGNFSEEAHKH